MPSSTPAGMLTESDLRFSTRPSPRQDGQGSAIVSPTPRQVGQVCSTTKKPWRARTWPRPPHIAQVRADVPALAPEPRAGLAGRGGVDLELDLAAVKGVLELDLEIVAQVGAAQHVGAPAARLGAAHELAEDIVENVGEGAEILRRRRHCRPCRRCWKAAWPKRS